MEEQENQGFSWTLLFFVTGLCFWIFSLILKLLDADTHVSLFSRIGLVGTILGVLCYLNTALGGRFYDQNPSQPAE